MVLAREYCGLNITHTYSYFARSHLPVTFAPKYKKYKKRYTGNTTITTHSLPEASKGLRLDQIIITITNLYNFDPLKPHFYIAKQGFYRGTYYFCSKNRLWYSLEPPLRGGSNEYPQSMFWAEIWKNIRVSFFFIWKLSVFGGEIFNIFE